MKSQNIYELLEKKSFIVPSVLLSYYRKLNLEEKELLFLSYLISIGSDIPFDVMKFSSDLDIPIDSLMNMISSLCEKNILAMIVKKDNELMKEYLDIKPLYQHLLSLIINSESEEEIEEDSEIYTMIEQEFARPLSPIEYETIKHWKDSKIDDSLIKAALKEAVLNGVTNLRYIEKILSEWKKKGYKTSKDIIRKKQKEETIDIFDCDWLNENE